MLLSPYNSGFSQKSLWFSNVDLVFTPMLVCRQSLSSRHYHMEIFLLHSRSVQFGFTLGLAICTNLHSTVGEVESNPATGAHESVAALTGARATLTGSSRTTCASGNLDTGKTIAAAWTWGPASSPGATQALQNRTVLLDCWIEVIYPQIPHPWTLSAH